MKVCSEYSKYYVVKDNISQIVYGVSSKTENNFFSFSINDFVVSMHGNFKGHIERFCEIRWQIYAVVKGYPINVNKLKKI